MPTRTQPIPKTACALYNFFRLSIKADVALLQLEEMDKTSVLNASNKVKNC